MSASTSPLPDDAVPCRKNNGSPTQPEIDEKKMRDLNARIEGFHEYQREVIATMKLLKQRKQQQQERWAAEAEQEPDERPHQILDETQKRLIARAFRRIESGESHYMSIATIAHTFDASPSAVRRIKRRLSHPEPPEQIAPKNKKKFGRPTLLAECPDALVTLMFTAEKNRALSALELRENIESMYSEIADFVPDQIFRVLRTTPYTYKTSMSIPPVWNSPAVLQERVDFANCAMPSRVYYFGEQQYDPKHIPRAFGWTPKGGMSRKPTWVSLLMCIGSVNSSSNSSSIVRIVHVCNSPQSGVDTELLQTFLKTTVASPQLDGAAAVLVLDKEMLARLSKDDDDLCTWLSTHPHIQVQSLPSYSPFLNPLERCYVDIKDAVVRASASECQNTHGWDLVRTVEQCAHTIPSDEHLRVYCTQADQYRSECRLARPFEGTLLPPTLVRPESLDDSSSSSEVDDETSTDVLE